MWRTAEKGREHRVRSECVTVCYMVCVGAKPGWDACGGRSLGKTARTTHTSTVARENGRVKTTCGIVWDRVGMCGIVWDRVGSYGVGSERAWKGKGLGLTRRAARGGGWTQDMACAPGWAGCADGFWRGRGERRGTLTTAGLGCVIEGSKCVGRGSWRARVVWVRTEWLARACG